MWPWYVLDGWESPKLAQHSARMKTREERGCEALRRPIQYTIPQSFNKKPWYAALHKTSSQWLLTTLRLISVSAAHILTFTSCNTKHVTGTMKFVAWVKVVRCHESTVQTLYKNIYGETHTASIGHLTRYTII